MKTLKCSISLLLCLLFSVVALQAQQPQQTLKAAQTLIELNEKRLDEPIQTVLFSLLYRNQEPVPTASAWQQLGELHAQRNRATQAFVAYFMALHFDLDEKTRTDLTAAAKLLAEKSGALSSIKEKLSALIDAAAGAGAVSARELKAIVTLNDLEYPKLFPAIVQVARLYALRMPLAGNAPLIWLSISEMEADLSHPWEALASALFVVEAYAHTDLAAAAQLRVADIYAAKLKKYPKATANYRALIESEKDSALHADARWGLAQLRDKKEKAYSAAVQGYREFIDTHPDDMRVPRAWMRVAELQIHKLKQPESGIQAYAALIQSETESDLLAEARLAIGKTYEQKMKDYAKAVSAYVAFASVHKDHEKAPDMLYQAGRLAEEKLKDPARAIEIYNEVVNGFTAKKPADAARARIKKLEKAADGRKTPSA